MSELQLFPGQTEDLEEKIAEFHREHVGKTTQDAEFLLLANARRYVCMYVCMLYVCIMCVCVYVLYVCVHSTMCVHVQKLVGWFFL